MKTFRPWSCLKLRAWSNVEASPCKVSCCLSWESDNSLRSANEILSISRLLVSAPICQQTASLCLINIARDPADIRLADSSCLIRHSCNLLLKDPADLEPSGRARAGDSLMLHSGQFPSALSVWQIGKLKLDHFFFVRCEEMLIPRAPPGSAGLSVHNAVKPLVWDTPKPLPASPQLDHIS